jgi:hypothetical protein
MSDALQFTEDGLEIHKSLAEMLDKGFEAEGAATIGTLGLTMGGVIGAAAFAITLINFMTRGDDNEIIKALQTLQREIDEIKTVLADLHERVNELVDTQARDSNRQTLRDLQMVFDGFYASAVEFAAHPGDVDRFVDIANRTSITCEAFLRSDYEFWRWIDVVVENGAHRPAADRFKNMPTLPVYVTGYWFGWRRANSW